MTKKKRRIVLLFCSISIFILSSIFILYGPFNFFKNFWITSAMTTMNHKYLARIFYSEYTIRKVMANNYIIELNENTDTNLLKKNKKNKIDNYEKNILNKDEGNDLYKVIKIQGSGYRGFLVAIYDASKIKLALSRFFTQKGETLLDFAKNNNAEVAINASAYNDADGIGLQGTPTGSIIKNGEIVFFGKPRELLGGVIGFDKENNLILAKDDIKTALTKYNLRDAIEFGPFLIVNGKPSFIKGDGGWGIAPRTAIGQRSDGIVLFLIIDGRKIGHSLGADMVELTSIMTKYKAINAANLDGGSSTSLVVKNKLINKPAKDRKERYLPTAWIVTK